MRPRISATIRSSDTSSPFSMTAWACSPSGVRSRTAARSMSPVEMVGYLQPLREELGLGSLAAARGAEKDDAH